MNLSIVKRMDGFWLHIVNTNGHSAAILLQDANSASSVTRNILETALKEQDQPNNEPPSKAV